MLTLSKISNLETLTPLTEPMAEGDVPLVPLARCHTKLDTLKTSESELIQLTEVPYT
jgi:hypothetical protein